MKNYQYSIYPTVIIPSFPRHVVVEEVAYSGQTQPGQGIKQQHFRPCLEPKLQENWSQDLEGRIERSSIGEVLRCQRLDANFCRLQAMVPRVEVSRSKGSLQIAHGPGQKEEK